MLWRRQVVLSLARIRGGQKMGLSIETETVILADADGFADEAALSSA